MGTGYKLRCTNCGEEFDLLFGIGFLYPEQVKRVRQSALNGEFGEEWKKIINDNPYYIIEPKEYLYWCPKCHCFEMGEELSIYKPKNLDDLLKQQRGEKTVKEWGYDPWGISRDNYELVKEFVRECPKCKTKMERKDEDEIEDLELICPECGGKLTNTDTIINWD